MEPDRYLKLIPFPMTLRMRNAYLNLLKKERYLERDPKVKYEGPKPGPTLILRDPITY
jgi:hypothetical protein